MDTKNLKGKTVESNKVSGVVIRVENDGVYVDASVGDDEQFSEEYIFFEDIETIDGKEINHKPQNTEE